MTTRYADTCRSDVTTWPLAKAEWLEFSNVCPQFAVSGSEQAFSKFIRAHKDELHAAGVVVRLSNGTWLGHPERFREAIMAKLAGRSLPPLKRKPAKKTTRAPLPISPTSARPQHAPAHIDVYARRRGMSWKEDAPSAVTSKARSCLRKSGETKAPPDE
jgi:hypothetical protein